MSIKLLPRDLRPEAGTALRLSFVFKEAVSQALDLFLFSERTW